MRVLAISVVIEGIISLIVCSVQFTDLDISVVCLENVSWLSIIIPRFLCCGYWCGWVVYRAGYAMF